MAPFYPIYARRSDGKREIVSKTKRVETNEPLPEQLDQKPDKNGISDFYREVAPDESKHLDWRRKLGGMLARELAWKPKDGTKDAGYMLVAFPQNYRLYEHVKKKVGKDGTTETKTKTHAAGGNERQDAYLYGHPAGRKKRFRSPADFFPHLLWLVTDESGDPDNCSCKICTPDELLESFSLPDARPTKGKLELGSKINAAPATKSKQDTATSTLAQRPASTKPLKGPVARPLPQPKSADQQIDQRYNGFIYRPGELVWFQRGQAWGLGTVLRRWAAHGRQRHYSVQPLSQPYHHPQSVVKTADNELRPWLAWSVPKYTIPGLNTMSTPPTYDTADWAGMQSDKYGHGDVEVDASIMAAKRVDASHTPFSPNASRDIEPGISETTYDGIFLGAEKCWIGDPLRLVRGNGVEVLVLLSIVESRQRGSNSSSTYLLGDIYMLQRDDHTNPSIPTAAAPNRNPNLPPRMTEDLAVRNARSIPIIGKATYWKLNNSNTRVELNEIKGRWYEASLIMPILNPPIYHELYNTGRLDEMSTFMNSRGDCQRPPHLRPGMPFQRENVRRETRREAFGEAMPPNAHIQDGLDAAPQNIDPSLSSAGAVPRLPMDNTNSSQLEIDPRFETAESAHASSDEIRVSRPGAQGMQDAGDGTAGNFDDFMNLDGEDDGDAMRGVQAHSQMPGFGAEYGSQGGYY